MDIVIIGNGIAGVSAAESARGASSDARITLIGAETSLPYYRMNLIRYLAGEVEAGALLIHPESWYEQKRILLKRGVTATAILADKRAILLGDGSRLRYDKLVLATGALPRALIFQGAGLDGVLTLRTLSDADEILRRMQSLPSCACIGGGTLGLELAAALSKRGLKMTVIENHEYVLQRLLTARAAAILEKHLAKKAIRLMKNAQTTAILGEKSASGVVLSDGRIIDAELVIVAAGMIPETRLAEGAGIRINRGILVDDHMRTSDSSVFAAGDAAELNGVVYGTWAPAKSQGETAGLNAAGLDKRFEPVPRSNTLNVLGMNVFSMGRISNENEHCLAIEQEQDETLRSFLFEEGRLVACIIIGDTKCAAAARKAIEKGADFSGSISHDMPASDVCGLLEK